MFCETECLLYFGSAISLYVINKKVISNVLRTKYNNHSDMTAHRVNGKVCGVSFCRDGIEPLLTTYVVYEAVFLHSSNSRWSSLAL